MQRLKYWLSVN